MTDKYAQIQVKYNLQHSSLLQSCVLKAACLDGRMAWWGGSGGKMLRTAK